MIEMKENLVETLLDQAIKMANIRNEDQLISITKKINKIDPVIFFENAKKMNKDRIFWSSTADDFYIVGIGNAAEIRTQEERFIITEEYWNDLLKKMTIHNPYQAAGTGVIALGGLSFDPKKDSTSLWAQFDNSQFTIPEFLLTKNNEHYYFTITKKVHKDDEPLEQLEEWKQIEKQLLSDL